MSYWRCLLMIHNDAKHIRTCIQACVSARDGRGRWRQKLALIAALQPPMQKSQVIAMATAEAACNFGAWLAKRWAKS